MYLLFSPYLHLIKYDSCSQPSTSLCKLSKKNEFFCVLVILRHGVDEGIVAYCMSRIFVAWITLGSAIFSKLNLTHPKDLIMQKMPKQFVQLGYSNVVLILDATEMKLTNLSNLKLNFFSFILTIRTLTQPRV